MRRLTLLLILTALALAAAACGGDDDDDDTAAAASSTTDGPPETLAAEAASCPLDAFMLNAVTGLQFLDPDPIIPTGDGVSCTFAAMGGETGIGITTYTSTGEAAMDTARGLLDDAEDVTLDFADAAIWSPGQTTLHVLVGNGGAQVQITDFSGDIADPLQVATELAELAVAG